jgi:glycosyltransferase involved in cell wall biosynthesis
MARDTTQAPPLRVAQIIESMAMGGAEHLAVKTANHLAAAGHDSHLIVTRGPDVLSARIQPDVKVHYLHYRRSSVKNPLAFGASLRKGVKLIAGVVQDNRIPVVQTHLPGSNFLGLMLAWKKTCGVLATIHNNQEFNYGGHDNPVLTRLRKKAYRKILDTCQGVIAVSEEVRSSLIQDLNAGAEAAARIAVVTNAVEVPPPLSPERRVALRQDAGVQPDQILILAAGRFCEQKNFTDLVTAANLLKESGTPFRLIIAGDGEERSDLMAQVERLGLREDVSLPGNLTNLDQVMQAADVFVMSSLWEGLPLVLLEAMAAGLPVVAYAIEGIAEVVADGVTGLTVPVGDAPALAGELARLAVDKDLRQRMGVAGENRIRADYSFEKYVAELTVLYRQAAGPWQGDAS